MNVGSGAAFYHPLTYERHRLPLSLCFGAQGVLAQDGYIVNVAEHKTMMLLLWSVSKYLSSSELDDESRLRALLRMCDLSDDMSVADLEVMVRARRATILEDQVANEVVSEEGGTSGIRRAVREALTKR